MSEGRAYVMGLPVIVTVHDDGKVTAWVDLAEADSYADEQSVLPDEVMADDSQAIARAFAEKSITVTGS